MHSGIPNIADLQSYDLIILDDLLNESNSSQDLTKMFTQTAHHLPCFVIFVSQNLFPKGKDARTRSLNTHYYVIFKNPRDKSQFEVLARQMLPTKYKTLVEVFEDATRQPYGYLFIDFTQDCEDKYRYRTNLFQHPMVIYQIS